MAVSTSTSSSTHQHITLASIALLFFFFLACFNTCLLPSPKCHARKAGVLFHNCSPSTMVCDDLITNLLHLLHANWFVIWTANARRELACTHSGLYMCIVVQPILVTCKLI
ncbi:hypothetical protein BDF22DRAFT_701709, partial [Syncephalis plumigaleata]